MFASGCSLIGVTALAAVLTAPPAIADKGPVGSAYALSVATTLLDRPLVRIDPRPTAVYPRGGSDSLVKVGPDVAGLVTANVLNASSVRKGRALVSEASIADVVVKNVLRAEVVSASCTAGPSGLTGRSGIARLWVLGQKVDVTSGAEIDVLGVAKVRVDEQVRRGGTLTVNAVHVTIGGRVGNVTSADIVLAQAKCTAPRGGGPSTTPTTTRPTTRPTTTTTTPPATTTTTTRPPSGGPGTSTTEPPATTPTSATQGIRKTADDEDLAETGASAIVPISLAGLALLAGGGTFLFVSRRRRAADDSTES